MSKLTIYQDSNDLWRWTLKARNGRIIGASTQGYKNKSDCLKNIDQVADGCCLRAIEN